MFTINSLAKPFSLRFSVTPLPRKRNRAFSFGKSGFNRHLLMLHADLKTPMLMEPRGFTGHSPGAFYWRLPLLDKCVRLGWFILGSPLFPPGCDHKQDFCHFANPEKTQPFNLRSYEPWVPGRSFQLKSWKRTVFFRPDHFHSWDSDDFFFG